MSAPALFLRIACAAAALAVAGCGFQPLYARNASGTGAGDALAAIYVEPMPERVGYQLRNDLLDLLNATGEATGATYRLKLVLRENTQGVTLERNATISRFNYTLTAQYDLFPAGGTTPAASGVVSALAAFNVASSPFATVIAERDATDRAAKDVAERIRTELAVYFRESSAGLAAPPGGTPQ
jgi:LPS-assembly lipoprotein